MTLQEVFNAIPAAGYSRRVPSVSKLTEEGVPVIRDEMDEDNSATIYSNGYVVYESGKYATVFPLHECRDYKYCCIDGTSIVPFSEFADQPWQIRVFMEGKDRLVHNQNNRTEGRTVSIDAYETELMWRELSDKGRGDPLRILVERNAQQEEIETLHKNLDELTERQRQILIMAVVKGIKREDIAAELGMTHQAVTDFLTRSLRRLRKMYGVEVKEAGRNCFSHKDN